MRHSEKQQRIDDLTQQMGRILHELADLEPPDIIALPLALPLDLAAYVSELAAQRGVEVPPLYVSALLHGLLHGALEHGLRADVQRLLAMIRRLAPDEEWQHFVAQHPGVREAGDRRLRDRRCVVAKDFRGDAALGPLYDAVVAAARMLDTYAREITYVHLDDQGVAGDMRAAWARITGQIARIQQHIDALPQQATGDRPSDRRGDR